MRSWGSETGNGGDPRKGELVSGSLCGLRGLSPAGDSEKLCGRHLGTGLAPHKEGREYGDSCQELSSFTGERCTWDVDSLALTASLGMAEQRPMAERAPRQRHRKPAALGTVCRWPGGWNMGVAKSAPPPGAKQTGFWLTANPNLLI